MTLPVSVPVGFHANDPEITALQDAVNALLSAIVSGLSLGGTVTVAASINVGGDINASGAVNAGAASLVAADLSVSGALNVTGVMTAKFGTPAGAAQSRSIYQGTGAPSNSNGTSGDFYLRTDTPGTANQRLYVKNGVAWSGIL